MSGHTEIVKLLLEERRVDVNLATPENVSPLFAAAANNHEEIVQLMLENRGADLKLDTRKADDDFTPLHIAVNLQNRNIVKLLMDHHRRRCRADSRGVGAVAARGVAHANFPAINLPSSDDGSTPLMMAAADGGDAALIRLLLAHGAATHVNYARGNDMLTALHVAGMSGNLGAVQALIVYGASVDAEEMFGDTVATLAVAEQQPHLGKWLTAVAGWSSLRVAVDCRMHRDARTAMRLGLIDPDQLPVEERRACLAAATTAAAAGPVCQTTAKLAAAACKGWRPTTHCLYHGGVRTAVYAVLLVAERLQRRSATAAAAALTTTAAAVAAGKGIAEVGFEVEAGGDGGSGGGKGSAVGNGRATEATGAHAYTLPTMPPEMWTALMGFFLRSDWAVPPPPPAPHAPAAAAAAAAHGDVQ